MNTSASRSRSNRLHLRSRMTLFATSYLPLFLLISLNQVSRNFEYMHWGGLSLEAVEEAVSKFGLSIVIGALAVYGIMSLPLFLRQMKLGVKVNGLRVRVHEIKNRNNEAISYIGTYIIPFLFQDYSSYVSALSIVILLVVIYFIYINSTLLLINPVLNLRYSLYELDLSDDNDLPTAVTIHSAMVITRERFLEEHDVIIVRNIGQKLFFATNDVNITQLIN